MYIMSVPILNMTKRYIRKWSTSVGKSEDFSMKNWIQTQNVSKKDT